MARRVSILAIQKKAYETPRENMQAVTGILTGCGWQEADFIVLPEIFTCPYENAKFPLYAQEDGGEVYRFLQELAVSRRAYVVGGSVPESEGGRIYNTSYVFDRTGRLIGKHRKVHLFDIDVPGRQYFRESDTLAPGDQTTVFETEFGRMGLCICFDIRFPEMFLEMHRQGVVMTFVPAAFNMTTGPAHWETLFKARALDTQAFILGCAPARDENASYVSYGHTILVNPWGQIEAELDEKEGVLHRVIDPAMAAQVREQIPLPVR